MIRKENPRHLSELQMEKLRTAMKSKVDGEWILSKTAEQSEKRLFCIMLIDLLKVEKCAKDSDWIMKFFAIAKR